MAVTQLLTMGVVSMIPLGSWIVWLESQYPGLTLTQFREHIGRVPHIACWQNPDVWMKSWTYAPYQIPFVVLGVFMGLKTSGVPSTPEGRSIFALASIGTLAIVLSGCWRADSYVYLWSGLFLIVPALVAGMARLLERTPIVAERRFLMVMMGLTAAVALRDPVTLCIHVGQFPWQDRHAAVFARLHEIIPPKDRVGVTPRFWHAFQGRNPIRQTAILPWISDSERQSWDWIVLPERHGTPEYRQKLLDGFQLFESRPMSFAPFAPTFAADERGWGYELWRNCGPK
jgi:hypothetical protein